MAESKQGKTEASVTKSIFGVAGDRWRGGSGVSPAPIPGGRAGWPLVFVCFLALTVWLRRLTFLDSVADWDESIYLLVARSWLEGHVPYTAVVDNKPPGVYALFALAMGFFGRSVETIRGLTCVAIAATSTGLFAIGRSLGPRTTWAGAFAGFFYAVAAFEPAANTEYFFVPFTVLMTLLLLRTVGREDAWAPHARGWWWAGLAAGLALQVKYLAAIELFPIAALALLQADPPPGNASRPALHRLRSLAEFGLAAAVPTLLVLALYGLTGHLGDWYHANVTMNRALAATILHDPDIIGQRLTAHVREYGLLWVLAVAGVVTAWMRPGRSGDRFASHAPALWLACALAGVLWMGARFQHYFVELHAPLALCAGLGAGALLARAGRVRAALAVGLALCLAFAAWWAWNEPWQRAWRMIAEQRRVTGDPHWGDDEARVAAYLHAVRRPGDELYVVDGEPILYFLVEQPVPTRYAFPPLLVDATLNPVAGVDAERELRTILARAPRFVVRGQRGTNEAFYRLLDPWMERFYFEDPRAPIPGVFQIRRGLEDSLRAAVRGNG